MSGEPAVEFPPISCTMPGSLFRLPTVEGDGDVGRDVFANGIALDMEQAELVFPEFDVSGTMGSGILVGAELVELVTDGEVALGENLWDSWLDETGEVEPLHREYQSLQERMEQENGQEVKDESSANWVVVGTGRGEFHVGPSDEELESGEIRQENTDRKDSRTSECEKNVGSLHLSLMSLEGRGLKSVEGDGTDSSAKEESEVKDQEEDEIEALEDSDPYEDINELSESSSDEEKEDFATVVGEIRRKIKNADQPRNKDKGGSSDEEEGPPRTKHELAVLPKVPKVDTVLQAHHQTLPIGTISSVLGNHLVVAATDHKQVLNEGSILWLLDRLVPLGLIDEVFGPVQKPYYLVRFNNESEVPEGAVVGKEVAYVPEFANYVLDNPSLHMKACDASGIDDEELADEEVEFFSDDEKEEAAKRLRTMKKRQSQVKENGDRGHRRASGGRAPGQGDRSDYSGRGRGGRSRGQGRGSFHHEEASVSQGAGSAARHMADISLQGSIDRQSPSYFSGGGRQNIDFQQNRVQSRPPLPSPLGRHAFPGEQQSQGYNNSLAPPTHGIPARPLGFNPSLLKNMHGLMPPFRPHEVNPRWSSPTQEFVPRMRSFQEQTVVQQLTPVAQWGPPSSRPQLHDQRSPRPYQELPRPIETSATSWQPHSASAPELRLPPTSTVAAYPGLVQGTPVPPHEQLTRHSSFSYQPPAMSSTPETGVCIPTVLGSPYLGPGCSSARPPHHSTGLPGAYLQGPGIGGMGRSKQQWGYGNQNVITGNAYNLR